MRKKRPRSACTGLTGLCLLCAGTGLLLVAAVAYALPMLTNASMWEMRDHFDGSSLIGKFVLDAKWIIYLMLGVLAGVIHGWFKEEGILQKGLEEWRRWRSG